MGSISRQSRSERFIKAFGRLFMDSKMRLPTETMLGVKEQGLVYDSANEVVRFWAVLVTPSGKEIEVYLADWPEIYDPEYMQIEDVIDDLSEMLGVDGSVVKEKLKEAKLLD